MARILMLDTAEVSDGKTYDRVEVIQITIDVENNKLTYGFATCNASGEKYSSIQAIRARKSGGGTLVAVFSTSNPVQMQDLILEELKSIVGPGTIQDS